MQGRSETVQVVDAASYSPRFDKRFELHQWRLSGLDNLRAREDQYRQRQRAQCSRERRFLWRCGPPSAGESFSQHHERLMVDMYCKVSKVLIYTVTVTNALGAGATSGTVTVTESLPSGLTLVSMAGVGWTCAGTCCTRSDALSGG